MRQLTHLFTLPIIFFFNCIIAMELEHQPSALQRYHFKDTSQLPTELQAHIASYTSTQVWVKKNTLQYKCSVNSARCNKNNTLILTALGGNIACLQNINTGECIRSFPHDNSVNDARFNKDETLILTASNDCTARLWHINTGECIRSFPHDSPVNSARFNKDNTLILTTDDYCAYLWHTNTGQFMYSLSSDKGNLKSACFSKDSTLIVIILCNNIVYLYDTTTGEHRNSLPYDYSFDVVCLNKDNTLILRAHNNAANLSDIKTGQCVQSFVPNNCVMTTPNFTPDIYSACFNKNNTQILTAGNYNTAHLWDIKTGRCIQPLVPTGGVKIECQINACFNKDNTLIVTASEDKTVCLWKHYTHWTLDQLLLYKLLFTWLLVQKASINTPTIIDFITTIKIDENANTTQELTEIWYTFPSAERINIWHRIYCLIQKYGKA